MAYKIKQVLKAALDVRTTGSNKESASDALGKAMRELLGCEGYLETLNAIDALQEAPRLLDEEVATAVEDVLDCMIVPRRYDYITESLHDLEYECLSCGQSHSFPHLLEHTEDCAVTTLRKVLK